MFLVISNTLDINNIAGACPLYSNRSTNKCSTATERGITNIIPFVNLLIQALKLLNINISTNWYILGIWEAWKNKLSAWAAIHIYIVCLIYNILFTFIWNEKNMANGKKEHYALVERLYWQVFVMTVYKDKKKIHKSSWKWLPTKTFNSERFQNIAP